MRRLSAGWTSFRATSGWVLFSNVPAGHRQEAIATCLEDVPERLPARQPVARQMAERGAVHHRVGNGSLVGGGDLPVVVEPGCRGIAIHAMRLRRMEITGVVTGNPGQPVGESNLHGVMLRVQVEDRAEALWIGAVGI